LAKGHAGIGAGGTIFLERRVLYQAARHLRPKKIELRFLAQMSSKIPPEATANGHATGSGTTTGIGVGVGLFGGR
jgi:hypothetical protein